MTRAGELLQMWENLCRAERLPFPCFDRNHIDAISKRCVYIWDFVTGAAREYIDSNATGREFLRYFAHIGIHTADFFTARGGDW